LAGEADDLVVLADRLALRNFPERQLMACRNPFCHLDSRHGLPGLKIVHGDGNVVFRMELDVLVHGRQ
jgi:hypothetical protein